MVKAVNDHIRARLLRNVEPVPLAEMARTEWSSQFETYMRNRLIVGGYRHGRMHDNNRPRYDHVGEAIHRAKRYLEDGNQEHLVDVANLVMIEFVRGCCHPYPHWSPQDDGEHTPQL